MIVREAGPGDAEQLIAHVQRLTDEPDIDIPLAPGEFRVTVEEERELLRDYAHSDNSLFLVAEVESGIVGVLNCDGGKRMAVRHCVNLGMSVAREWRNRGVGTALLVRALGWAESTGVVERVELAVYARNAAAIHLYEKFGFEIEGRRRKTIFQSGQYIDDVLMARLL